MYRKALSSYLSNVKWQISEPYFSAWLFNKANRTKKIILEVHVSSYWRRYLNMLNDCLPSNGLPWTISVILKIILSICTYIVKKYHLYILVLSRCNVPSTLLWKQMPHDEATQKITVPNNCLPFVLFSCERYY
jgi:hypothetical protein